MINTFSLEEISQTGILDGNLIIRQYKLNIVAKFIEKKSTNPKLKQSEIAEEIGVFK